MNENCPQNCKERGNWHVHCQICCGIIPEDLCSGYGSYTCPHCGQKYAYEEGDMLILTEKQLAALRNLLV